MLLSAPRSSRYRKSLSSLLSWSKYNPTPPIFFVGDDDQFERERCRELQLTLDKLEGRVVVGTGGKLQRIGSEDETLDNVCGLMPMLGDQHIDISINKLKVEGDGFGNPLDSKVFGDWATGCEQESSSELESYGYDDHDLSCDENCDSADVGPMVTRDLAVMAPKNITHPAFSWLPDDKERWETSSRISEDSLFDDHTRQPPEPQFGDADKVVVRFSSLGATMETPATATPFYRDSLCSKILSESWSQVPVGLTCFEKAPDTTRLVEEHNTPRTLPCIPQFPCSNTLTQAKIAAFQGKPSFIRRVIKAIFQPMKMLASRNMKHHANPFNKDPMKGNPLEEHSENDDAANPSHSVTSKSTAKKVVFNDKVGYRLFRKDSLCAKGY